MRALPNAGGVSRSGGVLFLLFLLSPAACGNGPSEPALSIDDIIGTYDLTRLTFDPQGVSPQADILPALRMTPQLIITPNKAAQILSEDPVTSLFSAIGAAVRTTREGIRIHLGARSQSPSVLHFAGSRGSTGQR